MGKSGDLLLVFADALARSWKQITKFHAEGTPAPAVKRVEPVAAIEPAIEERAVVEMDGLIRDERGIRFARDTED